MPQYRVVVHYEGAFKYDIFADNPGKAEAIAMAAADSAPTERYLENLADMFITDCWEIEEK